MAFIDVEISDLDDFLRSIEEDLESAVSETLNYAQQAWAENVQNSSIREMILAPNAIQMESGLAGSVVLGDKESEMLAHEVEGHGGWDMKPGLLASPKAKIGKKGVTYIKIPFHGNLPGRNPFSASGMSPREQESYEEMIEEAMEGNENIKTLSSKSSPSSWWYPPRLPNPNADPNLVAIRVDAHLLDIIEGLIFK